MDDYSPQAHGELPEQGHETSEVSIPGIVFSLGGLALAGFFALLLMRFFLTGLQWWDQKWFPVQLTQAQKQMKIDRAGPENRARLKSEGEGELGRVPESYSRQDMEKHLQRTFPAPRLQYDDIAEMQVFRTSEEQWLASTGKDASGNFHIPVQKAIDLTVQQGLPQVSGPFAAPTLPSAVPLVPAPSPARR